MKLAKEILGHFKPYWFSVVMAVVFALIGGAFTILPPILTGKLVDDVLQNEAVQLLPWIIGGFVIAYIGKVVFESLQEYIQIKVGLDVITDMQLRAFKKLHKAPMSFFQHTPRGDMLYRLTHDVESIQNLNNTVVPRFLQQIISAVAAFATVIFLFWPTAIVMVGVFIIYLYPSFKLGTTVRKMSAVQRDMSADMYHHMQESIESSRLVRTFQLQEKEIDTQRTKLGKWMAFSIKAALISKVNWRLGNLFNIATPGVVMLIGGFAVWRGDITVGVLVACLGFIPTMFQPVRSLAENALTIQQAIPALQRLYEYFDLPEEHEAGLPEIGGIEGKLEMKHVTFQYPGTNLTVLNDISFIIEPGKHIGIVGTSGGGKSTIVQLLLGLYEPDQGEVLIDGKRLSDYDRNSFRRQVGVVSQETFLLNGTLKENLLYGKKDATETEFRHAAEAAGLTEFINTLPNGYETLIGERGLKLSGGQRQRVALARAILRHPELLIFDEATSSLDGETEERVQEALERLIPGRTTITIAHRLITVRDAHEILFLERGVIAERGTHEQLLSLKGRYYELYMSQYKELEKGRVG
ncbi:ABC transporter [Bacillus sp. FJAT-27916]|uniref:ABC transporter ATP-binding protein n=1 Tax=Bacillus sp. FJAT-27916 TaxID=1679169 RepID=UPI000671451A|nr:ABC transporter ATP-binding protein [Bacillus sp. FJAT-27916]KMY44367.1 ABC transporter [Bacillus sp. FJAT-27916]